jgi:fatty-acyl-CoA synthase
MLMDSLGSSEAIGMAVSRVGGADAGATADQTARFELGPNTRVLKEDGTDVVAGSGEQGRLALRGRTPIGYYKDEEKSAATFQIVDGERWSIPGDWAEVEADGTLHLHGRGSQCINTGGEKVFPEEVEEALKLHPDVADAAVIGVADPRFGQVVTAAVEAKPDRHLEPDELQDVVRGQLAGYKVPRTVVVVESLGRSANGKLDYKHIAALVATLGGV